MKYAIRILLVLGLAATGCNRDRTDQDAVSANSLDNQPAAAPAPSVAETPKQSPAKQAPPAYRPPASKPKPAAPAAPREEPSNTETGANIPEIPSATPTAPAPAPVTHAPAPERATVYQTVPIGTAVSVLMIDSVGTDTSQEGDTFTASLAAPLAIDGKVVAEKGDRVEGRVQNVEQAGKVKGRAQMELVLTKLTTGGRTYSFASEPFMATAADSKDRDAGVIAGGAGLGAIIGAVAGGKKGAAIGAIIGGGSGTTAVLVTRGKDMRIESETKVNFVTQDLVRLPLVRTVLN